MCLFFFFLFFLAGVTLELPISAGVILYWTPCVLIQILVLYHHLGKLACRINTHLGNNLTQQPLMQPKPATYGTCACTTGTLNLFLVCYISCMATTVYH